jgi:hypothetical protein
MGGVVFSALVNRIYRHRRITRKRELSRAIQFLIEEQQRSKADVAAEMFGYALCTAEAS